MVLKDMLDGVTGQKTVESRFSSARSALAQDIKSLRLNIDCDKMSEQLTNIYYNKNSKEDYLKAKKAHIDMYLSEQSEQIINRLNNFSLEEGVRKRQTESQGYIKYTTLENSVNEAKRLVAQYRKICDKMAKQSPTPQNITNLLAEISKIAGQGSRILTAMNKNNSRSISASSDKYGRVAEIINQLGAFIDFSASNGSKSQATGDFFEKALATFADEMIDANSDLLFKELKKDLTAQLGQKTIKRGNFNSVNINATFSMQEALKIAGEEDVTKLSKQRYHKNEDGTVTISYSFNPSEPKQGKMDVLIGYKDSDNNPIDVRASAKHWSSGSGDLGYTSIAAGLARQSGNGLFNDYILAVLKPQSDHRGDGSVPQYIAADAAHDYAKLALKADIAMGLNQGIESSSKAGYANLLIIDRGDRIVVQDLTSIILGNKDKKQEPSELKNYDEKTVTDKANSIYNSMRDIKSNRTNYYIQHMIPTLDKMRVTIRVTTASKSNTNTN